ncbi:coiled-coil domain-containing protein 152-like isoform X2 [Dysidea avara]|uniref:coiled-coil domain-containing protein 152-like isoform X2 n=1 Tax=Dysidea avara TaxID=196820 RepID=UPI003317A29C
MAADLNKLKEKFCAWQQSTLDITQENNQLKSQVKALQKQCNLLVQNKGVLLDENKQVHECVEKLQNALKKRCDLEENHRLQEQISAMKEVSIQLENERKKQMEAAMENLEAVQNSHQKEITQIQDISNQQAKKEVSAMQKLIQVSNAEVRQLQKQLADMERGSHTEIVKLRLEYDAKLLKLQKQTSRTQCSNTVSSSVNNEIFRKKLQHVRAESDREIAQLKSTVTDLERKLAAANRKRKAFPFN